jgi:protein SCO1/2
MILRLALLLFLLSGAAAPAASDLAAFAFDQKPGSPVPLDLVLRDGQRGAVRLGDLLDGRPAILVPGYFHCPNLCGLVRNDLLEALSNSGLRAARDYTLIAFSIDPAETDADARSARRQDQARYDPPGADKGWHYLTGDAESVRALEAAIGFRSRFDQETKQFLHPAGLVFLTSTGLVSGYLLGIGYQAGDLRLGVTRAGQGGLEKAALPVLLLCFHFDPATGRYTLAITRVLTLACVLTALTVGGTIALALRRERRS